ncbi:hypothetical protein A9K81_03460 [Pseudomonas syringae pv. syringae]|nr:hypothetical protein A9K81_03460 [Pseudomonas syringae pv. syringae]
MPSNKRQADQGVATAGVQRQLSVPHQAVERLLSEQQFHGTFGLAQDVICWKQADERQLSRLSRIALQ